MAAWPDAGLSALALVAQLALTSTVSTAQSLPADGAENATSAAARGGVAQVGADGTAALATIEAAVRADAARAWQRADPRLLKISVEEVTWSDGSLGCPRPGMAYTQALVPGWRLVLREDGHEAIYHASRRGQWLFCPGGRTGSALSGAATR